MQKSRACPAVQTPMGFAQALHLSHGGTRLKPTRNNMNRQEMLHNLLQWEQSTNVFRILGKISRSPLISQSLEQSS